MNLLQWEKRNYENRIRFATFESARRGLSPTCFLALHLLEWFQQREAQIYRSMRTRRKAVLSSSPALSLPVQGEREREPVRSMQAHARSRASVRRGWLAELAQQTGIYIVCDNNLFVAGFTG